MKKTAALRLTESAVMLAAALVLSLIPFLRLPFGGEVTLCAMLPVLLIAYRYRVAWGSFVGLVFALFQLVFGLGNLQFATSAYAAIAIIVLDYIAAYTVLGLGGIFRGKLGSQASEVALGALVCCALRYLCHVISGCTVWAGLSIPSQQALLYSLLYNATYLIPETLLTVAGGYVLTRILDLRGSTIRRAEKSKGDLPKTLAACTAVFGGAVLIALVFASLQSEDGFDITGILSANWIAVGITALVTAAVTLTLFLIGKKRRK